MSSIRIIVIILVVAVLSIGSVTALSYFGYFKGSGTFSGHTDYITIYEEDPYGGALAGMNGSYWKSTSTSWPVVQVNQGDKVIITIINTNSSEVHGFAIDHYDPTGVATAPGHSNTIEFVASEPGKFRMYCNVFCTIHATMQNGELIVVAS